MENNLITVDLYDECIDEGDGSVAVPPAVSGPDVERSDTVVSGPVQRVSTDAHEVDRLAVKRMEVRITIAMATSKL